MKTKFFPIGLAILASLLSVSAAFGQQKPQMMINQSALMTMGTGSETPIMGITIIPERGFSVDQVQGFTMRTLARAAGNTLSNLRVSDPVSKPALSFHGQSGNVLEMNSGWENNSALTVLFNQIGAFPFAPQTSSAHDAAIVRPVGAGSYTVQATDPTSVGKKVLFEVYNTDRLPNTGLLRFGNLSARGKLPITLGIVNDGVGTKRYLVRAVGPGLARFGVQNTAPSVKLEIYNAQGAKTMENDAWSGLSDTFSQVGAFGLDAGSRDAAVIVTLTTTATTSWTAQATGNGVALVELYELP